MQPLLFEKLQVQENPMDSFTFVVQAKAECGIVKLFQKVLTSYVFCFIMLFQRISWNGIPSPTQAWAIYAPDFQLIDFM